MVHKQAAYAINIKVKQGILSYTFTLLYGIMSIIEKKRRIFYAL